MIFVVLEVLLFVVLELLLFLVLEVLLFAVLEVLVFVILVFDALEVLVCIILAPCWHSVAFIIKTPHSFHYLDIAWFCCLSIDVNNVQIVAMHLQFVSDFL